MPAPLCRVSQHRWPGRMFQPGHPFTFHRNTFSFNLRVAVLQDPMILGQNSTASHEFELTAKTTEKSNVLCNSWHGLWYFYSCCKHLGELYLCLYLKKKASRNQGLPLPNLNCNYQLTQTIYSGRLPIHITDFCLNFECCSLPFRRVRHTDRY